MDKLLVISSYPAKGQIHYKKTVGIASYAKNTLLSIKESQSDLDILVLAEKLTDETSSYEDDGIKVKRVWQRGSWSSFPSLLSEILKSPAKNILLEFEVSMFGNPLKTAPLPFLNFAARLFGKKITAVVHQAITNLSEFEGHTNIKGVKSKLLSTVVNSFYSLILLSSNKVIVFEDALKQRFGDSKKIVVIPHGVETFEKTVSKEEARKKLKIDPDKRVLLVFGYVAWYKGTDWLVDEFNKLKNAPEFKDYLLIVGGGPNPNHKNKKFYMDYVNDVIKKSQTDNIIYSGFVEESEIPTYYQASDAVILPYRAFMSASGPLSIAYSFGKPAFVSSQLKSIFQTQDIKKVLNDLSLNETDLTFELTESGVQSLLNKIKDAEFLKKVTEASERLNKERNFKNIGKLYIESIFNEK